MEYIINSYGSPIAWGEGGPYITEGPTLFREVHFMFYVLTGGR